MGKPKRPAKYCYWLPNGDHGFCETKKKMGSDSQWILSR